jgi:hypothetical protein
MDSRPNATEVAGRLLALRCVVTHAIATPSRDSLEQLFGQRSVAEREDLVQKSESLAKAYWNTVNVSPIFPYLSPWEREFANSTILTMSSQDQIDALWRAEAAQVLMWALCLIAELPAPDAQANPNLMRSEGVKSARRVPRFPCIALRTGDLPRARNRRVVALAKPHGGVDP